MTGDDGTEKGAAFVGEEGGDDRSTPRKDLAAAIVIGAFAILAMVLATRLQVPDTIATAPGLLPFLTGLSLLAMALGLGIKAARDGAATGFLRGAGGVLRGILADVENARTLLLMAIIAAYVIMVDMISFDLRFPNKIFTLHFSSYEAISIPVLALILRIFWRASWPRCVAVSLVAVIALTSAFRDGFAILLPGSG